MITKASELDWENITHFSQSEWPDGALEKMNASVIWALSKLRNRLPPNSYMIPSPLYSAHVRESGRSRHSTNYGNRLSDATDFFMSWGSVWEAWHEAIKIPEIGGLGIYMDTEYNSESTPMMHIDTRPDRIMWVRTEYGYIYYHRAPVQFFYALGKYGRDG